MDPSSDNNRVICRLGDPEIIKLLLADPRIDPGCRNNKLLILASINGYSEIVNLLLADQDYVYR